MNPHKARFSQRLLLAATLFILFTGVFSSRIAYAQQEVTLAARVGFDGYCKENVWLPVHIIAQNSGTDLNANLQAAYQNTNGGRTSSGANITLPGTSRKEFFLYIYPQGYLSNLNVTLSSKGRVFQKVDLRVSCISKDNLLVGVLADKPSTYDILNDVRPFRGFTRVAQLDLSDLPDRAQAWRSLDALIVSNIDTGKLSAGQKQALSSWIATGGKLLVIGGANWQSASSGIKDLLPIDLNSTRHVSSLSQLQGYANSSNPLDAVSILATGTLRGDAKVLVEQEGVPLIVERQMGFGAVYFLAADPALQPLSGWEGMKTLYSNLISFKPSTPQWMDVSWNTYTSNQALATIPELRLPSILYICGLLVFYVIVIGPINYLILKRANQREAAWITIPFLVIIFTCVAYVSGSLYRGSTPILNRLVIAQAWDGVDRAEARALVGVYSPLRTSYNVEAADQFMPRAPDQGNTNDNWISTQDGEKTTLSDIRTEIGGMKTVALDGSIPALKIDHNLAITLDNTNAILSGNITNKSQSTLKDVIIFTPGDWKRLGDMPPGSTKSVRVSLYTGSNGPDFYSRGSADILNIGYDDLQKDEKAARRNALLQTALVRQYAGSANANWGIYLMGWIDQPILPISLQGRKFKTIDTMLYFDLLSPSIKTGSGALRLPISLFAWESLDLVTSAYGAPQLPAGGYTLQFKPAYPIRFKSVTSLEISIVSNVTPGKIILSVWNRETESWDQIPFTGYSATIDEPKQYVDADGGIKIKIDGNQNDYIQITSSNITLTVEP